MTGKTQDRSWHSTPTASRDVGYGPGLGPNAIGLFTDAMFGRQEPVWSSTVFGPLADGKFVDELISEAETLGARLVEFHHDRNHVEQILVWDEGVLTVRGRDDLTVTIVTTDKDIHDKLVSVTKSLIGARTEARVHMLTNSGDGICLRVLGKGGRPLERGNYTTDELAQFDHIVGELTAEDPCGRLTILLGPPGTGKTYFIEGLIAAQPGAKFVLIPPHMVAGLTTPGLVGALQGGEGPPDDDDAFRQPIVLLVEDADDCLVSRMQDNLPALSTLLNLAAGILGRWLDVRVIATSNATTSKIDPALKRPGRLCRLVQFGNLDKDHANTVLTRLGSDRRVTENMPLAEIYARARQPAETP